MLNARGLTSLSRPRAYDGRVLPLRARVRNEGARRRSYLPLERGEGLPDFSLSVHARYTGNKGLVCRAPTPTAERIAARTLPIKRIQRASLNANAREDAFV